MTDQEMSYRETVSEVSNRVRAGADVEQVIRFMRDSGLDVMDSIMALKDAKVLSGHDAKLAVFQSPIWADTIGSYDEFHNALISEIDRES